MATRRVQLTRREWMADKTMEVIPPIDRKLWGAAGWRLFVAYCLVKLAARVLAIKIRFVDQGDWR